MREINMKDLYLSCSEDVGPLSKLNILPFQNNMEELVRSFHSLPIPPYKNNMYINKQTTVKAGFNLNSIKSLPI